MLSGTERELIRRTGLGHPNVSPDGRYISTASRDQSAKTHVVLLIPIAGGEPRELLKVNMPDTINLGTWTPDSRSLLAVKNAQQSQAREMFWVPIDGPGIQKVQPIDGMLPFSLRVHRDGRQVAYVSGAASGPAEVWVLENFLPPANVKR